MPLLKFQPSYLVIRQRTGAATSQTITIQVTICLYKTAPALDIHHPFHLHGYDFFVMAMDQFRPGETTESISNRLLATNFRRSTLPARKDTITVPSNGYAAVRFRADNPGETPPVPLQKDKTSNWIGVSLSLSLSLYIYIYIYIYIIPRTLFDVLKTEPQISSP